MKKQTKEGLRFLAAFLITILFYNSTVLNVRADELMIGDYCIGAGMMLSEHAIDVAETEDLDIIVDAADTYQMLYVSVGGGNLIDSEPDGLTTLIEEYNEENATDSDEDSLGGCFGYTNLGIVQVEDHLNVRESEEDGSKIIGKMSNNAGCEILEIIEDKAHIVSGSVEGYISTDYILMGEEAVAYAESIVKTMAVVSGNGLKVRTEPSLEGTVINLVAYGEELEVVEDEENEALEDWVKVLYDGEEAYVSAEYVTVGKNLKTALNMTEYLYGSGVSDVRVELCEYAKQFVGNPYVWGGTSLTKGADCSGFVLSVFAKFGITLPHSSSAQANMGTKITMAEAQPGDLIFYSKNGRINHVAIYIGGGQVIHASSPKTGIRITSAYYRTPTKVVRILQD